MSESFIQRFIEEDLYAYEKENGTSDGTILFYNLEEDLRNYENGTHPFCKMRK